MRSLAYGGIGVVAVAVAGALTLLTPALMTILGERNWYGPWRAHDISRRLWRREHA